MSTDEQPPALPHTEPAPPAATHEAQDEPVGVRIDPCPVCSQNGGIAYRKAHGAGTRIVHPRRAFPCTTATVVPELDELDIPVEPVEPVVGQGA